MKAVIPVAGIGSRNSHNSSQSKALVPVAGKPLLAHIIDKLMKDGIHDFVFVVGYMGTKIESFVNRYYGHTDITVRYVMQEPCEGTGHAIWSARHLIRDENEILIMLGDTIIDSDLTPFMESEYSMVGVKSVERPDMFGVAELEEDGFVKKLIERPTIPKSNLAITGLFKIANPAMLIEAVQFLVYANERKFGEYQLTDALMYMVEWGEKMRTTPIKVWYDCGRKDGLLNANAILLNRDEYKDVSKHDRFRETIIIPPVSIGDGCEIHHSIIGPNITIGKNTRISHSIIQNTIVGSNTSLQNVVLNNSVIGDDTLLRGFNQSLNIGDNAEINFTS